MLEAPLHDLNSWVQYFSTQELPILASSQAKIRELNGKLDDIGLRDITNLVTHDPLLSLRLVRYLESHRHTSQITDVTTLDRILLMIGLSGFFRSFGASHSLENKLASYPEALQGCKRVCYRAYLAARIASGIATRRRDLDPAEISTAVLLHNTAEILLWVEAPVLAMRISELMRSNPGMRSRDAQRTVLGISLHELHLALLQKWHLPQLMRHLLDERFKDEPRVRTVLVATSVARHINNGWQDPGLPDDLKEASTLIGLDPDGTHSLIQKIAIDVAREWQWYGITPAATWLALATKP